ncbi:UDP-rhamnose/UDP-galactose transporter 2-like [Tasmannia lanceolata]|uniref:UDP-rhamnose/UDP-galactose transporter 2-like n=1 Tax=Tasmannia lanceolata TaxID=3420 RepID=UPI004062EA21
MVDEKKSSSVSDVGAWAMNVVSSVGIIMANKQLMSPNGYDFRFATTLTGFHFAVTALVGFISNATGYSASKHVPLWELLWFSIVANMSITGMNLSLMLNSVGFYQISKLSMIPVVCIMEWILHGKQYSREVKIAVVVVVIGVGVCTVTDVKVNAKGFLCACVAVLSTSLQQISIGSLQKKYSIGSFELLSKTAPIQALSLLLFGPFIDYYLNGQFISNYKLSSAATVFILLSCSLAVFCNVSQYLCIGRFSAVSFQVLGHMKTVCVLTLGWLLFDSELTLKNILGMATAVLGMVIYSWAVEIEKKAKANIPHTKNSLTEEEIRLLKDRVENTLSKDVELGESKA